MQVSFSVNVHFPLGDWWLGSIAFKRLRTALLYSPCQKKWGIKTFELNKYLSSLNVKSWINVLVLYLPFQFWFSRPWRRKVPWSGKKKNLIPWPYMIHLFRDLSFTHSVYVVSISSPLIILTSPHPAANSFLRELSKYLTYKCNISQ